ncbi:EscU/YscU/HrcU family type III secretion system export apparatus switch protein [Paraneptunicella aestuarii]|uniref:EscU/YscU/HrcU family type III secretion system export apparatus switch protein n=1 Tax=Paraneptunicella aestuarii TaxID=2831148 RepID=UPI001E416C13|nr:EscU/YscU/HrcU family type III secretion system export apparatus switch protein [Paraneptunicella aestuarii]UAA37602.1 EscU/YscU/HrcU family type III secretion system export apparatus switch protein [Paraneptunicella aestuarii]
MAEDQEKSEQATPYKLREAKNKGQVSKSVEVTGVLMLTLGGAAFWFLHSGMIADVKSLFVYLLATAGNVNVSSHSILSIGMSILMSVLGIFAPILVVLVLGAIAFNLLQTGPVFSTHPLSIDWNRFNPVEGFKKIISLKSLFELFKSLLKLAVISVVWFMWGDSWLDVVMDSYGMSENTFAQHWQSSVFSLALMALAILLPIALLDFIFSNWQFAKKMMMSKQEVKDEHKKREGDPKIKQKQKQIQKELLQKAASLSSVKDADVVITNPEHIAVALKYDPASMFAPKVLTMGADHHAATIRKLARTHRVPIVRNIKLARQLYRTCNINGYIPESCYKDVAPVFRSILGMDRQEK